MGPPASYPWERQVRDLERVVRESPEVPALTPSWGGLKERERHDQTHRLLQLGGSKRLTNEEQQELDRINREHAGAAAATTRRSEA